MANERYIPFLLKKGTDLIAQLDPGSVSLSPNLQRELDAGGHTTPIAGITFTAAPQMGVTLKKVDAFSGIEAVSDGVTIYYRKVSSDGTLTTTYKSFTFAKALIVPKTLSASKGGAATLTVDIFALSANGTDSGVSVGTSAPSAATPFSFGWTAGAAILSGARTGVTEVSFDFGYSVESDAGENGQQFPTAMYVMEQAPKASLTCDMGAAVAALLTGSTEATDMSLTFNKVDKSGVVAVGSLTITAAKVDLMLDSLDGNPGASKVTANVLAPDYSNTDMLQIALVEAV